MTHFFLIYVDKCSVILPLLYNKKSSLYEEYISYFKDWINWISCTDICISSLFSGICTTRDIDFLLNHINNARYLRAMDFGRVDHFTRARLLSGLGGKKVQVLVAASTIRYRKPVYLFMPYRLESQVSFRVIGKKVIVVWYLDAIYKLWFGSGFLMAVYLVFCSSTILRGDGNTSNRLSKLYLQSF